MTIKKRLAISNLLMILVPVCITGAMALLCLGFVWAVVVSSGVRCEIRIFGVERELTHDVLKLAVAFAGIVLLFVVAAAIYMTNRFLTRFVFRKIEQPLNILAEGVREIGSGNLDYRIAYADADEFAPICAQFNDMAARLKASVDETQRHEESRKELMASLSHDLRSPLTAILAYVDGLLDGVASTPEKQREYLLTIQTKAEQLRDMVSEIFLYSKMELEAFPVHCRPMALSEELAALVSELAGDYSARGLDLELDAGQPAAVWADPDLLRRCIVNILDNSAKYKTAPRALARMEVKSCPGGALLTITDDGPGVPEEALPKLFEVFYRADAARTQPAQGSGLGLAIAARAVQRCGGSIAARNAEPHGLCVEITLKEAKADA